MKIFENANILITGGTGSIGRIILQEIIQKNPNQIIIFDNNKTLLSQMARKFKRTKKISFKFGDITNINFLHKLCQDIDIIFHCAAIKDIVFAEQFPERTIKVNVLGTKNIIDSALEGKVKLVVNLSTDKAVYPTTVLGYTKLLTEQLVSHSNKIQNSTIFCSIRLGNVFGSSCSVIPINLDLIKKTKSVNITNPKMTRFIISPKETGKFILHVTSIAMGGEIFIPRMCSIRIDLLVKTLILFVSTKNNSAKLKIKVNVIGSRANEKIHEKLFTDDELCHVIEKEKFFIISNKSDIYKKIIDPKWISSKNAPKLTMHDVNILLQDHFNQKWD